MTNLILLTEICFEGESWHETPAETDHTENHLVFHQSNLKTGFSNALESVKHDENYSFQEDLQSRVLTEVSKVDTERRMLLGRFRTGQLRQERRVS